MADKAQTKTILLVEDEAIIAMQEARQLEAEGYGVIIALSGEEAIASVQAATPPIDLILMDIDLGRGPMDGAQTADTILQVHDIPVVFLSSFTEAEIRARTEQITSYGYVLKGSEITVLTAALKQACKLHASHQSLRPANTALETEVAHSKRAGVGARNRSGSP